MSTTRPSGSAARRSNVIPAILWAIHSVAHVLEMQGRSAEGVEWLPYTPEQWADKNPFKAHVWWHAALFHAVARQADQALELYDMALCSVNSDSYVDVSNQAALLKRIEFEWHRCQRPLGGAGRAFGEAHPRPHAAVP